MASLPFAALVRRDIPASFRWPVKFCLSTTFISWLLSVLTGNVSQVDRVWTFLPTIYTAYYALLPLWPHEPLMPLWPYTPGVIHHAVTERYSPRALLMLGLVVIWMFRLSYNTWRRGLFNLHDEDYRWQIVRNKIPRWLFKIVNLVFIAVIQNIILFLLGIPTHIATFQQPAHLSTSDYILGALALIDIALEFVSDNQQYSFQTYKKTGVHEKNEWIGARIKWTPQDAKRGFVTRGLWAWSRHPNFFCEQTFWALITLFPLLAPESPNLPSLPTTSMTPLWPLTPALVLCILFFSSTRFTESISLSKYPEAYSAYRERVAMFVPLLTPVWGLLLQLRGKKAQVDEMLFGQDEETKKEK
ncbi:DUF1295-domain-containing protein [Laetiporus sulphureus 93-53]|uniref:DUF1295-domain-containing protein n=1 Tax=Laetiporus sulphureus 93-53 TaxID=1314785 RepID=A0A165E0T0_9APHY|nr:DUF1295-domain-containing protein [Laetiporus sulphureus 93-53]KZT06025.1 DUF1295-domain-containing protein [Laetiporus sulphureus 93-53]